eukprot:1584334-Amphidinium_carterae.1
MCCEALSEGDTTDEEDGDEEHLSITMSTVIMVICTIVWVSGNDGNAFYFLPEPGCEHRTAHTPEVVRLFHLNLLM